MPQRPGSSPPGVSRIYDSHLRPSSWPGPDDNMRPLLILVTITIGCDVAGTSDADGPGQPAEQLQPPKAGQAFAQFNEVSLVNDAECGFRFRGAPKNVSVLPLGSEWPSELDDGSWVLMIEQVGLPYVLHIERFLNVAEDFPSIRFAVRLYVEADELEWVSQDLQYSATGPLWVRVRDGVVLETHWDRVTEDELRTWVSQNE